MSPTHPFPWSHLHSALSAELHSHHPLGEHPLLEDLAFNTLALRVFRAQFECNPPYQKWCHHRGHTPDQVQHWTDIPAVPTASFKDLDWSCIPPGQRTAVFHSSGTTAQRPSQHHHHGPSLEIYEASLTHGFLRLPWVRSVERVRTLQPLLVFLTPPREQAPRSSLVHMFHILNQRLALPGSEFVGQAAIPGEWTVDSVQLEQKCREAIQQARPVWMMGTAFNWVHGVDAMSSSGRRFELPPDSMVLETGGYKGRSRVLARDELHQSIAEVFGLNRDQVVSEYGMSELSSQGYTRPGDLRPCYSMPPWARVRVVSPETGREVSIGETGMVHVVDLANLYSVCGVATEDLAVRRADGFELLGRAPAAESRGCSIMSMSALRT